MTIDMDTNTIDIDEVIKLLLATGAFENKDEAKNQANLALELMKELQWYRGQDFIKFKDIEEQAVCGYNSQCPFEHFCDRCEYAILTMKNVYNIPQAEYRGDE